METNDLLTKAINATQIDPTNNKVHFFRSLSRYLIWSSEKYQNHFNEQVKKEIYIGLNYFLSAGNSEIWDKLNQSMHLFDSNYSNKEKASDMPPPGIYCGKMFQRGEGIYRCKYVFLILNNIHN
jgi:hypothetical protein